MINIKSRERRELDQQSNARRASAKIGTEPQRVAVNAFLQADLGLASACFELASNSQCTAVRRTELL